MTTTSAVVQAEIKTAEKTKQTVDIEPGLRADYIPAFREKRGGSMAQKSDFSAQEWEMLRDTPLVVAIAVAVAGGSGLFGSLKESIAPAKTIVEALQGNNTLLREICNQEEMKTAQGSLREQFKETEFSALREKLRSTALSKVGSALDLLKQKAGDEDHKAYQDFVTKIATRVAEAAKEGGFFGFGGERISENEQALLKDLSTALG